MVDIFEELAELYSIQKGEAYDLWIELACEIAMMRRHGQTGALAGTALKTVSKRHALYFLNADSRMKAAIQPLLQADPAALAEVGLYPKKLSVCGLAEAAADLYNAAFQLAKLSSRGGS